MTDKQIIFTMSGVNKIYPPNKQVLKDISISYFYGAKIGIIGMNGAGKSSLLRIMAGIDTEFQGEAVLSEGYTVGLLPQHPDLDPEKTVREVVMEGAGEVAELLKEYEEISLKFGEMLNPDEMDKLINRQGEVQNKIEALDGWNLDTKLNIAMDALRCPPDDMKVGPLSGGEKRRVALCRLLLQEPDILLLDEPTNHLDAESVDWLENHLKNYAGTVILITHDRYFLDNVTNWILELDRGKGIPWKGNYASWLEQKEMLLKKQEKEESKRQRILRRELDWIKLTPKDKAQKNRARLKAYERLLEAGEEKRERDLEIFIPPGPRLGDEVISAEGLTKAYGDRLLIENMEFKLPPAAIVGVIGPNGAGKTTLFKMITGKEEPDSGSISLGQTVQLSYVDQEHEGLNQDESVFESITGGNETMMLGNREVNSRAYVARFNFSGTDQSKKVSQLSGGERNRLHLARMLKSGANVILLDEPTNDLDVNTLRALEEGLENFAGTVVVISHDRYFLDRVCTHILAFEGDSQVYFFEGNYAEYEENRKKRHGDTGPKRIRYKKLAH